MGKIKIKYTKEDLLWEATRRNKLYQDEFQEILDKDDTLLLSEVVYGDFYGNDEVQRIRNLIFNKKVLPAYSERWGIEFYNPYISVDEINIGIQKGEISKEGHPYYNFYGVNELPAIEHKALISNPAVFDKNYNDHYHSKDLKLIKRHFSYPYFIISPKYIINRTIVSFNPESNINDIVREIKKIRKQKLKNIKQKFKESKIKGYNPSEINAYIGWLSIYDDIEKNIIELIKPEKCEYKDGVVILPDNTSFMQVIPSDYNSEKFESERRRFERAFSGASDLIKASPNIYFNPTRVPK